MTANFVVSSLARVAPDDPPVEPLLAETAAEYPQRDGGIEQAIRQEVQR